MDETLDHATSNVAFIIAADSTAIMSMRHNGVVSNKQIQRHVVDHEIHYLLGHLGGNGSYRIVELFPSLLVKVYMPSVLCEFG